MVNRGCSFEMSDGLLCQAPAMRGKVVCYWHDPERAEDVADARRLGGLHRRKAASVATIYDFAGLRSIEGAQRLLETAALETFALNHHRVQGGRGDDGAARVDHRPAPARA